MPLVRRVGILIISLFTLQIVWASSLISTTYFHPVITLSAGVASVNKITHSSIIPVTDGMTNTYADNTGTASPFLAGLFAGVEFALPAAFTYQVGISYSQLAGHKVQGTLYQLSDPELGNFNYQYSVATQLWMIDNKLLFNVHHLWHPYLSVGLGTAINRASGYNQQATVPGAFDPDAPFANHSSAGFAYLLGIGVDTNLTQRVRLGLGYRYANLGKPQLGGRTNESTMGITPGTLSAHELLIQLSYIF